MIKQRQNTSAKKISNLITQNNRITLNDRNRSYKILCRKISWLKIEKVWWKSKAFEWLATWSWRKQRKIWENVPFVLPILSPEREGRWRAAIKSKSLVFISPPAVGMISTPGSPGGRAGLVKSRDLSLLYLTFRAVSLLLSIRNVQQPLYIFCPSRSDLACWAELASGYWMRA